MKSFNYVNDLGYNKIINISDDKNENGEYSISIWSGQTSQMETTGMFCGSGSWTVEHLNEFLKHYGIDYQFS